MGSTSYWQAEADLSTPLRAEPLGERLEAEVAIIGAGITGVAAALWLARAGRRAVVLEARRIAAGASGRNAGFLLGGTAEPYALEIARYGHERARQVWAYSLENHRLAAELIGELREQGWDCGYRQRGSLRLAVTEAELADIQRSVGLLRADGWAVEPLARADLPTALRAAYLGGSFHAADGEVYPVRYVRGLARLAQQAGATLYEESPVTRLREDGAGLWVETPDGAVHAQHVVLAANAWLPELAPLVDAAWLRGSIVPTRGQVLATAPIAESLFACPCYADEGYQYWRQLPDGRLVVGGWRNHSFATENSADETPSESVQRHLDGFVRETLGLAEVPIEHRWAGIMAFSADELPLVGRLPGSERCYIAGGYTGHGNAYAVAAARTISRLITGAPDPDAPLFDPARIAAAMDEAGA
ncbi:MAG TPA: FAD-binding oxidoreductase [Ktedonobacterales bacterium]